MSNAASQLLGLAAGVALLPVRPALAQQPAAKTALHTFFQNNYDSTIIYHRGSSWNNAPHYLILARQGGKTYFFTYSSPYRSLGGVYFPGGLVRSIAQQELRFRATAPDTNRYLLPRLVAPATLGRCWRQLAPSRLWAMQDDRQTLRPTATCGGVDDGDENTFFLIDKRAIKVAFFVSPDYWQECLGYDPSRQQALQARAALQGLLREANSE